MARTWGQIRFEIQKAHPGFDLDLLDGYIRTAYDAILDEREWKGLVATATLSTVAKHTTGTVLVTLGSTAIVGTGTAWTAAMSGRRFRVDGRNDSYTFTFVTATSATLDRAYEGPTNALATYTIFRALYTLPQAVKYVARIQDVYSANELSKKSQSFLDRTFPHRPTIGVPQFWAPAEDTAESGPFVTHQVELYPAPEAARGYPYDYQKAALAWDGVSTTRSPLPWVNDNAILAKARSLIYNDEGNFNAVQIWDAHFQRAMARMHLVESQRQGPQAIKMHPRFTEHFRRRGMR